MSTSVCTNSEGQTMHHLVCLCLAVLPSSRHRASYPAGAPLLVCICSRLLDAKVSGIDKLPGLLAERILQLRLATAPKQSTLQLPSPINFQQGHVLTSVQATPHQLLRSSSILFPAHLSSCAGKQDIIKHVLIEDRQAVVVKLVFFCKYDWIL